MTHTLSIDDIRVDGGTQSRARIEPAVVAEYAEALSNGTTLPPIVVFHDGATYWLADGFHRLAAWREGGAREVPADVRQGDRRAAVLHSVGANATHGLRRTNEDKRRAVLTLLEDPEWRTWPQVKIAQTCGVTQQFVSKLSIAHPELSYNETKMRTVERNGTTYELDTSQIGRSRKAEPTRATEPVPAMPTSTATRATDDLASGEIIPKPAVEPAPEPEPAAADGADGSDAKSEPQTAPDPVEQKLRREFRALTAEGREDTYVALMLDLRDCKSVAKKQAEEIRSLKELMAGFEGDQAETIRRQAQIIRHKESEMFRANDKADRALARAKHLEKRLAEIERLGIAV